MPRSIRMFCGEFERELVPGHLAFRAAEVRRSIAALFAGTCECDLTRGNIPGWYLAHKGGWRVVPVLVTYWKTGCEAENLYWHGVNRRAIHDIDDVLAQLRHAYANLIERRVFDPVEFADGLIAPQIRRLEGLRK